MKNLITIILLLMTLQAFSKEKKIEKVEDIKNTSVFIGLGFAPITTGNNEGNSLGSVNFDTRYAFTDNVGAYLSLSKWYLFDDTEESGENLTTSVAGGLSFALTGSLRKIKTTYRVSKLKKIVNHDGVYLKQIKRKYVKENNISGFKIDLGFGEYNIHDFEEPGVGFMGSIYYEHEFNNGTNMRIGIRQDFFNRNDDVDVNIFQGFISIGLFP